MIRGVVNDRLEPLLTLQVRGPSGIDGVEAVLDTGFDGALSLPTETIERLGLEWQRSGYALLADGSEVVVDIYDAEVEWDDGWRPVSVDAADTAPLVGVRLLRGRTLRIDVIEGGRLEIGPLSEGGEPRSAVGGP